MVSPDYLVLWGRKEIQGPRVRSTLRHCQVGDGDPDLDIQALRSCPSVEGKWKRIDTYLTSTVVRLCARVSTSGLSLTIIPT